MIGSMPVKQLAQTYGTPLYVYDEDNIRRILESYRTNFVSDQFETGVLYASKAFSCKAIVKLINEYGMYLDVVSGGELYTAKAAGYDCTKVFFHGNNKTPDEIEMAMEYGVGTFVVDNPHEAALLAEKSEKSDHVIHTLLRINPGIEAHTHKYIVTGHVDSKFGISMLDRDEIVKTIRTLSGAKNIVFDGFHAHIGSQIFDAQAYGEEIRKMFAFAKELKDDCNIAVSTINLGGGFSVRYTEADAPIPIDEVARFIIGRCEEENAVNGNLIKRVLIEPGRSIVAESGYTIYTVGATKKTPNRLYAFVDGGMADNIRPALYQAEYDAFVEGKENMPAESEYTIAGKCCESGDILIQQIALPRIEPGDLLVMKTTGAYGYSMASHYNKLRLPAVVFAGNGESRTVIRRETYEDLIAREEE